jgi:diadenosine tetraphosphatase ApaH/serine/threonine PP2A family protein phosphatase
VRIALLSDIHGNAQALAACLAHAEARGVDRFAFLGDFVGYGGDPGGVVRTIAAKVKEGAVALKGNHDEAVEKGGGYFNEAALAAIDLARTTLDAGQRRFLDELPLIVRDGDLCFVHASAASPGKWDYVDSASAALRCADAAQTRYVFCGHVHDQALYFETAERKMREFRPVSGVAIPVRRGRRWVALAHARLGSGDRAVEILRTLSPVSHARTPESVERYRVEPYVVAADVYSLAGHFGQGGWTWYTGSAGWTYRIWLEEILGLRVAGDELSIDPVIPAEWPGLSLRCRLRGASYDIRVENPDHVTRGVAGVQVDGEVRSGGAIRLGADTASHVVVVRLGPVDGPDRGTAG